MEIYTIIFVQINANNYTQVTNGLLPAGVIASVEGTPLDFTKPIKIGKMIDEDFGSVQTCRRFRP